jgi:hypothetical protein
VGRGYEREESILPTTWTMRTGAVLCAGILMAGCSTRDSTDASAVASSDTGDQSTAAIDPAALDTGDYPTTPAAPFGLATLDTLLDVETQRLAEFVTVPFEVDPELTDVKNPTMVLRTPSNLAAVLNEGVAQIASDNTMLYGYVTTAAVPKPSPNDSTRSLVNAVIRFGTTEAAAAAARQMHDNLTTVDSGSGLETPASIDVLPDTLVSTQRTDFSGPEVAVNAFTAHGTYVLYTYAKSPEAQKDWTATAVAKALSLQAPLIDRFPGTPTREQNGGERPDYPLMDQDKILIYAIPEADPQAQGGDDMAVYGPRGMAHRSSNPPLTYKVLTETGSEHNASYKTTVYRADDEAGAQRILNEFVDDQLSNGYTEAPTPQGLPTARCVSRETSQGPQEHCMVANGRYVGEASGLDNKTDVDQRISAQYLILNWADQNAK